MIFKNIIETIIEFCLKNKSTKFQKCQVKGVVLCTHILEYNRHRKSDGQKQCSTKSQYRLMALYIYTVKIKNDMDVIILNLWSDMKMSTKWSSITLSKYCSPIMALWNTAIYPATSLFINPIMGSNKAFYRRYPSMIASVTRSNSFMFIPQSCIPKRM